ncbi:hypothetical protein LJR164_000046 [Phenylobacterium sp. LjRoot164]|uniref:hypothetical protein n=1 Tax=unclassified Phenylobacterium TaxID=2640670 RepID=UPI003ECD608F
MRKVAGRSLIVLGALLLIAPLAVWIGRGLSGSTQLLVVAPTTLILAAAAYTGLCCALVAGGVLLSRSG